MRCSSFEPFLDHFVEGALRPRQMRSLTDHLESCRHCRALVDELKVIDAMLATTPSSEPATDFTHAVMAGIRPMPVPRKPKHPAARFVALYVAVAWAVGILWLALSGTTLRTVWLALSGVALQAGAAFDALIAGGTHALGTSTASLAAFGVTVLAIDAALALALCLGIFLKSSRAA